MRIIDYIGDSVYVEWDDGDLRIYTNNGWGDNNNIYLEPAVLNNLLTFIKRRMDEPEPKPEKGEGDRAPGSEDAPGPPHGDPGEARRRD